MMKLSVIVLLAAFGISAVYAGEHIPGGNCQIDSDLLWNAERGSACSGM